jgi:hypothetical protein
VALSAEQKAENKRWQKARDRAHTARRHQLEAAEKAAELAVDAEYGGPWDEADAACRAHVERRDAAVAAFDARIAAIRSEKEAFIRDCEVGYAPLQAAKRAAWERRNAARHAASIRIEQEFPDLLRAARYSPATWGARNDARPLIDAEAAEGGKPKKKA